MVKEGICCFCGKTYNSYGNDIRPLVVNDSEHTRCCDECNLKIIIPNRIKFWGIDPERNGYAILDLGTGKFLNKYGLPANNLTEILLFKTAEDAQHHIEVDYLFNCTTKKVVLWED